MNIFFSYLVHLFTVSGVVFSFLALVAIIDNQLPIAFLYLAAALFVDGIDGTLARKVDVKKNTPHINGENLDNIIDFLSYVFVPAFAIYWLSLVPQGLEFISACIILISSCYTFANNNIKTSDFYFSGFPALWNIVLLYFFILDTDLFLNFIIICVLSIFTFIPIKYFHPFRVIKYRKITLSVLMIWMITTVVILYFNHLNQMVLDLCFVAWNATNLYFVLLTLLRTFILEEKSLD